MESLIENYLGGRHTLMYMNMTLGMYHPCKGVAREAGNDVVCYCSQQALEIHCCIEENKKGIKCDGKMPKIQFLKMR